MRSLILWLRCCSVTGLKRQLMEARARKSAAAAPAEAGAAGDAGEATEQRPASDPVEWGRIFSEEDFERIRCDLPVNRASASPEPVSDPDISVFVVRAPVYMHPPYIEWRG